MDETDTVGPDRAVRVPGTVRLAVALVWTVIGLSGLTALLTVVLRDELVESWSTGKPDDLQPPDFVPVAITMFVVLAMLGWVLVVFFRIGHGWARWVIVALVAFAAFVSVIGLDRELPTAFVLLTVISLIVDGVLLVLLFHRDTNAYLRQD